MRGGPENHEDFRAHHVLLPEATEMNLIEIARKLRLELRSLDIDSAVAAYYNPLEYAWPVHAEYLRRFGAGKHEILLLGMNPGPWGMVQTGVPFGDVEMVRDWLGIEGEIGPVAAVHPKRPVEGFLCRRRETSGRRLWGWARDTFGTPEKFFARFMVVNYCPLCFFDREGRNRTPDKLPAAESAPLFRACDRALLRTVRRTEARYVIGVGRFAERRAAAVLEGKDVIVGCVTHPSGANPEANRGWGARMTAALEIMGIEV